MKQRRIIEDTTDYRIKLDEEISLKLLMYSQKHKLTVPETIRKSIRKFFGIEEPKDETVNPDKKQSLTK